MRAGATHFSATEAGVSLETDGARAATGEDWSRVRVSLMDGPQRDDFEPQP